ncbi:MAG: GntR family transcriptional regulator [Lachnospiraceae bacterium]|nr:GntR family transcriptional regulator [Lachnospiraceae bacterium]
MIVIDYKDARPIYEQVVERFSELILKGVLEADSQMPSVRSLAMELSINPNTIQKAYMELERRGYIYSVKGRGSFVQDAKALLNERKKNCLARIADETRAAIGYGITKEEIKNMVDSI